MSWISLNFVPATLSAFAPHSLCDYWPGGFAVSSNHELFAVFFFFFFDLVLPGVSAVWPTKNTRLGYHL